MSYSIGQPSSGRSAKELLLRIERCNAESKARRGELDILRIAAILEAALSEPQGHSGLMLGLAEFIGTAVDGSAIDLHDWTPLEHVEPAPRPQKILRHI
jgi:hypothetical protein